MSELRHFRLVGQIRPEAIVWALRSWERSWGSSWRNEFPGSPHKDTRTLFLRMPPPVSGSLAEAKKVLYEGLEVNDCPAMADPVLREAVWRVAHMAGGLPARAMIVGLKAGGVITPHIDQGGYAEATERYHYCVATPHPVRAWLQVEEEIIAPFAGEVWWLEKHRQHKAGNDGESERVHLIVDVWKR